MPKLDEKMRAFWFLFGLGVLVTGWSAIVSSAVSYLMQTSFLQGAAQ